MTSTESLRFVLMTIWLLANLTLIICGWVWWKDPMGINAPVWPLGVIFFGLAATLWWSILVYTFITTP